MATRHGFFNISTWLTASADAAILLLAYHLVTSRRRQPYGRGPGSPQAGAIRGGAMGL